MGFSNQQVGGLSSLSVGNMILRLAGAMQITPMKLQKLVYFSHGWMLAKHNRPLIKEAVCAWPYGPVIPELYHEFKEFRGYPITRKAQQVGWDGLPIDIEEPTDAQSRAIIEGVFAGYSIYNPLQLSAMTHLPDAPWTRVVAEKGHYVEIPNSLIKESFLDV